MIKSKKASVQDIMYIMIVLFVITIGTLIAFKVSDALNTKFQASSDLESQGKTAMSQINNMYPSVLDNSFMLLMIGLCIVAIALASMVRVHPVFFVFFFIILLIVIFLAGVFSNVYQAMGSNPNFVALADRLVYMTYVMRFLPFITGVMGFILAGIMYKSWQNA